MDCMDTLAERSKAVAQGAIPKGRGFEPHRCHFALHLAHNFKGLAPRRVYACSCDEGGIRVRLSQPSRASCTRKTPPTQIGYQSMRNI